MITAKELATLNNNKRLLNAILDENTDEIRALISKGAEPLGIIAAQAGETDDIQPFTNAVWFRSVDVLDAILESALQKYRTIGVNVLDLSRRILDDKNAINLLQEICVSRPEPAYLKRVIEYAQETKQDVKKLLNAPFPMFVPQLFSKKGNHIKVEVSLAEYLAKDLSIATINANLYPKVDSVENSRLIGNAWHSWYNSDADRAARLRNCSFIFKGPLETIKCLVKHGLNIEPLGTILPDLIKHSSDSQTFDNFFNTMFMGHGHIVLDSEKSPILDKENKLYMFVSATNKFNKHRIDFRLQVDFSELNEFVQNTLQTQNEFNTANAVFTEKFGHLEEEVNSAKLLAQSAHTKIRDIEQEITNLAEVKERKIQKVLKENSPESLKLFNELNHTINNELLANNLLTTGKLTAAKYTNTSAQMATGALHVLALVTNDIPFAGTVLSIVDECSQGVAQLQSAKERKNASKAVSGVDVRHLSIDSAAYITAHTVERCLHQIEQIKNGLIGTVKKSIVKLQKQTGNFSDYKQLVAFLCHDAINSLPNFVASNVRLNLPGYSAMASMTTNKPGASFQDLTNAHHIAMLNQRNPVSTSTALSTSTVAMNMAYTEISGGYDYQQSYSSSTDNSPPLVFSSRSGKKTPSPKSDNTIQSSHSGSSHSAHSSRNGGKKKKTTSKCSIM